MNLAPVVTVSLNPAIDRILEVPNLTVGEHQPGRLISRTPAGKAVNVSRALATLDIPSLATGFVGREEMTFFERSLDPTLIHAEFIPVSGVTRENVTLVDPVTHRETHIRDAGFDIFDADRSRLHDMLRRVCVPGCVVVFAGAMPRGFTADHYTQTLELCIAAGARVVVDTSGEALRAASRLPLWLMKPNESELAEIAGAALEGESRLLAAGRTLAGRVETVLVSRGRAGSLCITGERAWRGRVDLAPERVRNTVGCGDCMLAGYIAGRVRGESPDDAYRLALAAAAASAVSIETSRFLQKDVDVFRVAAVVEPVSGP